MKTMKTNGQVLSEKEMRDVKGGVRIEISVSDIVGGALNFCPVCGYAFEGHYDFESGKVLCPQCGAQVPKTEVAEEDK